MNTQLTYFVVITFVVLCIIHCMCIGMEESLELNVKGTTQRRIISFIWLCLSFKNI